MNTTNNEAGSPHNSTGGVIAINGSRLPVRIFIFLLVAELLFVFLDATINVAEWSESRSIQRLFNITREDGLATWFMVTQTFVTGLVLWVIFLLQRSRSVSTARLAGWGFLATFFTYLSIDDGAMIHERLGTMVEQAYKSENSAYTGSLLGKIQELFPSYEWQIVALPVFVGAGLFMLFFLWREFNTRGERLLLFTSAACMGIAVGLDFFEGLKFAHPLNLAAWFGTTFEFSAQSVRHFSKSLEEFLEMLAISVLMMLFLHHLIRLSGPGLTFRFFDNKS